MNLIKNYWPNNFDHSSEIQQPCGPLLESHSELAMKMRLAMLWLLPACAFPQSARIDVNAAEVAGPAPQSWAYFGYDEANYTYAPNAQKLIRELAGLSKAPVHIRTHFLLVTGDGKGGLKFGSTNAYTEDSAGNPIYNWTIVDKILGLISTPVLLRLSRSGSCRKRCQHTPSHTRPLGYPAREMISTTSAGRTRPGTTRSGLI